MTPQELIEKANLVRTLQDQLKILESSEAYMVIKFYKGEVYIRIQGSPTTIQVRPELQEIMLIVASTVRQRTINGVNSKINDLCYYEST